MNEGRKSQIVLLDERRLDIIIQPKLQAYELLDLVASHFKLREKHYFGLGYFDETNHFSWLQAEKRVLDHDFPRKAGLLVLYFSIRFYVETIGLLRDTQTVELFYLNARQVLFKGPVECDSETVFELAAHVLQATNGDFTSEEETREELKKLPLIPTSTLKEHPSITYCEDRVVDNYHKISGTSRGLAIVNYMTIIENLPTYGIHFYEVKDKKDIPWWLGISTKGIAVFDKDDRKQHRKFFTWKNLENLYYQDRKFSIKVSAPKRDEAGNLVSVSRRTFGSSNEDLHAWFASTTQLTKAIWAMAVSQHEFYLDRKQSKAQLPAARSMSEIAADLCRSTTSLPGSLGSDLSRSPSSHSLPSLSNSRYDLTIEQSDSMKAEREMVKALKARKEALEEALAKKTEELKRLCYEEGELTGVLPQDTPPLAPGEQIPTFRRRVGTAFSLSLKSDHGNQDADTQSSSDLSKLELEVELQSKITNAAHKLASDKTVSKYVRKQRRHSYTRAVTKLKEMEIKLAEMRRQMGLPDSQDHHNHHHHSSHRHHQRKSSSKSRLKEGMYQVVSEFDPLHHFHPPKQCSPQSTITSTLSKSPHHRPHLISTPSSTSSSPSISHRVVSRESIISDKDTDSCGNSIHSAGDYSIASSVDVEDCEGSVNSILHTCRSSSNVRLHKGGGGLNQRSSSQGSSLSACSDLSVCDVSERLDKLMDINVMQTVRNEKLFDSEEEDFDDIDDPREDIDSVDYSIPGLLRHTTSQNRNLVLSRGAQSGYGSNERRRRDFQKQFLLETCDEDALSQTGSCASSEYLDKDDSFLENDGSESVKANRSRQNSSGTLVSRRQKVFIPAKRMPLSATDSLSRTSSINKGYMMFEKYCLQNWDDCTDIDSLSSTLRRRNSSRSQSESKYSFRDDDNISNFSGNQSTHSSEKKTSRSSSCSNGPNLSHSGFKLATTSCIPLRFSSTSSNTGEKHFLRSESQSSKQSSQDSRGRSRAALTSCTQSTNDRSPSPVSSRNRISTTHSTTSSSSENSRKLSEYRRVERSRHVFYARSRTPDMRRTKSNLSTYRRPPAPIVRHEEFEDFDSVFDDNSKTVNTNNGDDVEGIRVYSRGTRHATLHTNGVNYPLRRGTSCPTVNDELSHNTTIETIV